jgi:hypothetical protein
MTPPPQAFTLPRPLRCLGTARSSFICNRYKTDGVYFAAGDTSVGITPTCEAGVWTSSFGWIKVLGIATDPATDSQKIETESGNGNLARGSQLGTASHTPGLTRALQRLYDNTVGVHCNGDGGGGLNISSIRVSSIRVPFNEDGRTIPLIPRMI